MKQLLTGHSAPTAKTSILWFRFLLNAIRRSGLDSQDIATSVGFDITLLENPDAYVQDEFTALLLMAAVEKSANDTYGLKAGQYFVPSAFGPLGYAMMTSADLRGALERTTYFTASVTDTTRTRMSYTGNSCLFEIQMPSYFPEVARVVDEFMMTSILTAFRWLVGFDFIPLSIEFMHEQPNDIAPYQKAFGRIPVFSSQRCAFVFSNEQLDLPLIYADDAMVKTHDQIAAAKQSHGYDATASPQVRRIIQQNLHTGEPTLTHISTKLNVSERTLQRRLKDEGKSFHDLADDVRCGLLDLYLSNPQLPLKEIATLLGFSDQSSFTRATQRWYGQTPKALRSMRQLAQ